MRSARGPLPSRRSGTPFFRPRGAFLTVAGTLAFVAAVLVIFWAFRDSMGDERFKSSAGGAVTPLEQWEYRVDLERELERRIVELLTPLVGNGNVAAKVSVDIDFSQRTVRRESYEPGKIAVRSEQRSAEADGSPAGFEQSGPALTPLPSGNARESRTTNYELNREDQTTVSHPGTLRRLTVAVAVNGVPASDGQGGDRAAPRSAEELAAFNRLVALATGIEPTRGDRLEVLCLPFVPDGSGFAAFARNHVVFLALALGGLLCVLVFAVSLRRR